MQAAEGLDCADKRACAPTSGAAGMSTFSTKGGLYEKAQKKFKLSDGKTLFTYTFFDRRRDEAQARRGGGQGWPSGGHGAGRILSCKAWPALPSVGVACLLF